MSDKSPQKVQPNLQAAASPAESIAELRPLAPSVLGMLVVGILLAGFIGYFGGHAGASKGNTPGAMDAEPKKVEAVNPDEVTLSVAQVASIQLGPAKERPFNNEKLTTGRIAYNDDKSTPVFSPYTGRVIRLLAKPGDIVTEGQPLFEIDSPDLVGAATDLSNAVANLQKSKTALRLATRNQEIANRNIASGVRKLELSRDNEERQKQLLADRAAAAKDYEQAQRDTKQAEQDLEGSNKDLEQAESDVKGAETDIANNTAALEAARDKLRVFGKTAEEIDKIEREKVIDRKTRVLSPISGTITQRKIGLGEYISQNITDPLFVITELSTMWMLADVYESDVAALRIGQDVEISVMAFPKESFKAKIVHIAPGVDPTTHRIAVRSVVDNPQHLLKSDMFANFRIVTGDSIVSPAVPSSAIVMDGERKCVWVASGVANKFIRKPVVTGLCQDNFVQIVSGIDARENVVAQGALYLGNINN